jgi:hypothetical protein
MIAQTFVPEVRNLDWGNYEDNYVKSFRAFEWLFEFGNDIFRSIGLVYAEVYMVYVFFISMFFSVLYSRTTYLFIFSVPVILFIGETAGTQVRYFLSISIILAFICNGRKYVAIISSLVLHQATIIFSAAYAVSEFFHGLKFLILIFVVAVAAFIISLYLDSIFLALGLYYYTSGGDFYGDKSLLSIFYLIAFFSISALLLFGFGRCGETTPLLKTFVLLSVLALFVQNSLVVSGRVTLFLVSAEPLLLSFLLLRFSKFWRPLLAILLFSLQCARLAF